MSTFREALIQFLAREREAITRPPPWEPWLWRIAAPALLCLMFLSMNRADRVREESKQTIESIKLQSAGIIVASQESAGKLRGSVDEMVKRNEELRVALVELEAKAAKVGAGKPRPVVAASLVTAPAKAAGSPRVDPPSAAPRPPGPPLCLLEVGDLGEVRVDALAARTEAGNLVVTGTATCWRLGAAPSPVLTGTFDARSRVAVEETKRAPAGWGVGGWVGVNRDGWAVGPAVAAPPLRFWGRSMEVTAGAGLGSNGAWGAGVTAVLR